MLKAGMKFTTTFKKGSSSTIRTTGTWTFKGGMIELRATRQEGRRFRRAKVDRFPLLEGGRLRMDYVVLEKR